MFYRSVFLSLVLALAGLTFSGCAGYRVGPVVPTPMKGVKTIAVPTFENTTFIPRLEALTANTVIKQIQQDGTYRITGEGEADAILEGRVARINRKSSRSVRGNVLASREYILTVTLDYEVMKRSTGEILDRGTVEGKTSFFLSGSDVNQDERQAIPLAVEDAAVRLVSRISEGW